MLGHRLRRYRYPNANLQQPCPRLWWSNLFRPILAFVYGEHASRWRLVRVERLLGKLLRLKRLADADVQQPLAGLRRQRLRWTIVAILYWQRPHRRRLVALGRLLRQCLRRKGNTDANMQHAVARVWW